MGEDEKRAFAEAVWLLVFSIPPGKVASYGQIASLCGRPNQARQVGRVLSDLPPDSRLPWHRVVATSGRITSPNARKQRDFCRAKACR